MTATRIAFPNFRPGVRLTSCRGSSNGFQRIRPTTAVDNQIEEPRYLPFQRLFGRDLQAYTSHPPLLALSILQRYPEGAIKTDALAILHSRETQQHFCHLVRRNMSGHVADHLQPPCRLEQPLVDHARAIAVDIEKAAREQRKREDINGQDPPCEAESAPPGRSADRADVYSSEKRYPAPYRVSIALKSGSASRNLRRSRLIWLSIVRSST
jgi:hypothetical protein